jgi:hypothetical protein
LASILVLGFLLRIVPILWGVPVDPFVRDYHPDEWKVLSSVVEFPGVYWTTRPFPGYGTSLQYLVGALLTPVKYLVLESSDEITLGYFVFAKLTARFLSVVSGVLSVYLTYILSMKLFDKTTAVISALFLSTAFFHVLNSPLATLDVATSFLLVLNFLCCFHAIEKKDTIRFAVLGVTTGLMIGTKLTLGLFFAVPLFLFAFDRLVPPEQPAGMIRRPAPSKSVAVPLVVLFSVALVVYFVLNPQTLLDLGKTVAFYAREKQDWVDRTKSSLPRMFRAWAESTRQATGLWVGILGCIGMLVPGKKRLSYKLSIVAFLLLYYGFWRWFLLPRYVITIAPLFCMFAANTCASLMNRGKIFHFVGAVAVGLVTILSTANCILGVSDRLHDSRPAASGISMKRYHLGDHWRLRDFGVPWTIHAWMYPKIDGKRYRLTNFLAEPEYLVMNRDRGSGRRRVEIRQGVNGLRTPRNTVRSGIAIHRPLPEYSGFTKSC